MKSLKYLSLSVPLLLVVALPAALAADDTAEKLGETPWYPLKTNMVWTYKIGDQKFKIKADKEEKGDKMTTMKVIMLDESGKQLSWENIQITKDGVYRVSFEGHKAEPPVKILALPPKDGEKWEVSSTIDKEKLSGTFKMGEDKELKIGDKKYETFYTESDNLDANGMKVKFKTYFAKDVGMVKQEITLGSQTVVIELEKYEESK